MKDRRRLAAHFSHERWLVSYADFVTLLFAFFVVLYASAQMDQRRAGRLSVAIESAFQQLGIFQTNEQKAGVHKPLAGSRIPAASAMSLAPMEGLTATQQEAARKAENFAAMRSQLEQALAGEINRNEAALYLEPDGLVISLREAGFFDSGSAGMKTQGQEAFGRVAQILQEHPYAVRIEGHTDTVPIHTQQFASNWELSTARATELVKLLVEKHGVAAGRLSAAGYAEFHPVATNLTTKGRQLNRRVDIVILTKPPPGKPAADEAASATDKDSGTKPSGNGSHQTTANPSSGGKTG